MKGGNIYDNTYEEDAIELINKSINVKEPLNQKSQEWYGNERASYLNDAIEKLNKKIKILNDYSKGWHQDFYGSNINGMNMNNNNNDKSSNSSTKKNMKNSNYNANNENMSGGKRYKKRHIKRTRKHRK